MHLELPPIGWQLSTLEGSQSDSTAYPSFLDIYATRLLAEPLRSTKILLPGDETRENFDTVCAREESASHLSRGCRFSVDKERRGGERVRREAFVGDRGLNGGGDAIRL